MPDYVLAGLLHSRMHCSRCLARMQLRNSLSGFYKKSWQHNVAWVCPHCGQSKSVTWDSPLCQMDLPAFDAAVNLWIDGVTGGMAARLSSQKTRLYQYYRIIRRASTFYIRMKVQPFLKLPGPVEIDETKMGPKNNMEFNKCPEKANWILG